MVLALQPFGTLHLLLLFQLNEPCNGLCTYLHENGNKLTAHIYYNGTVLERTTLIVLVNNYRSNFTTNSSGYISFFAPLGIGANRISIIYKNHESTNVVYYFGGLASLIFIPIGGVLLLAVAKTADFKVLNKRISLYFNDNDYDNDENNKLLRQTSARDMHELKYDCKEPGANKVAEFMLGEAAASGLYRVGNAKSASQFLRQNLVFTYNDLNRIKSSRQIEHIIIAALNAHENNSINDLKCSNSMIGYIMLYMYAIGTLKVIKCYG